jgi:uncharacterized protein involved in outer membrane biogenesis
MKWILLAVLALVVLAAGAVAAIPYLVDLPAIQSYVAQSASQGLGRPVTFADLSLSLRPLPAVRLRDLRVAEDPRFGTGPFLSVGEGRVRLRLRPLLSRRIEFGDLTLERPRLELIQDAAGHWNVASLGAMPAAAAPVPRAPGRGAAAAPAVPVISRLTIVEGAVHYQARPRGGAPVSYRAQGIRLAVAGLGPGTPVEVRGEARLTPGDVLVRLDAALTPPPGVGPLAAAAMKGEVSVEAQDVTPLAGSLLGPSRALGGPVAGRIALGGSLGQPALLGQLDAARLTLTEPRPECPPPHPRRLTLEAVRVPFAYGPSGLTSRPLAATLAGGRLALALDLRWEPTPLLSLREISLQALPLAPLLVDYLCQGYAVSGPLDLTGELSARPDDLLGTLNGQGTLKVGPGKVVGPAALALLGGVARAGGALSAVLSLDLPSSPAASPLDFDSITATYRIRQGRLTTRDLLYTGPGLTVAGAGEYGLADGRLDFDLTLKHGRGQIRARVTGTAASPSVRVVPGTILRTEPERLPGSLQKFLEGLGTRSR